MARFDRLARCYDRFNPYQDQEALLDTLRPQVHHVVLDVGGGTGQVGEALRGRCRRYVVVDPSGGMNEQARRTRPWVDVMRGDGQRLPVRDAAADRVIMVDALHHVPDQEACLREVRRVLGPGGRVVVQEFRMDAWWRRLLLVSVERLALFRSRFRGEAEWRRLFEMCGFRVMEARRLSWSDIQFVLRPA